MERQVLLGQELQNGALDRPDKQKRHMRQSLAEF